MMMVMAKMIGSATVMMMKMILGTLVSGVRLYIFLTTRMRIRMLVMMVSRMKKFDVEDDNDDFDIDDDDV